MRNNAVSMEKKSFYITTTLPYVNSRPHLGHALEFVRADVVARYKELMGFDVFFNTGTDEHGTKIKEKADELGVSVQEYVDKAVVPFQVLLKQLNIKEDVHFIRTTNEEHKKSAQEFWKRCEKDIYKAKYEIRYCAGCELEKTDSELDENGRCFIHPTREIEIREEENYYFAFSKYQEKLLDLYKNNPDFVIPKYRMNEIKTFVESGLKDFSISRVKEKMPWGVEVPEDSEQVMYVWFDALVNYISTLGWPHSAKAPRGTANVEGDFEKYWVHGTPVQYAGKDNLRQQSAMWQAMLMSAGIPNSHQIVIDGFINIGGQKMSKSLGNVIDPMEWVEKYGTDAVRYYVIRELHPFEDSDVTEEKFVETYNANLVNGLGNQVSRVMNMIVTYGVDYEIDFATQKNAESFAFHVWDITTQEPFNLQRVMDAIWGVIQQNDQDIAEKEPFKLVKTNPDSAHEFLRENIRNLYMIAIALEPFMPETSKKIQELIEKKEKPESPLFPRIE